MPNAMVNLLIKYFYCLAQNVSLYGLKPIKECQWKSLIFMNNTGLSACLLYFKYSKKKHEKKDVEVSVMDGEFSVEEF